METGYIRIVQEEGKVPSVEAGLVDNNLWLVDWEIARLFNCFPQKVRMKLRSIFKSSLLREDDVTLTYRYIDKGVERQRVYYNLEVLIFLSYRIATFEAKVFRQFINSTLRNHLQKREAGAGEKLLWLFKNGQDFWLN